jgi:hypothetical protein
MSCFCGLSTFFSFLFYFAFVLLSRVMAFSTCVGQRKEKKRKEKKRKEKKRKSKSNARK